MLTAVDFPFEETKHYYEQVRPLCTSSFWPKHRTDAEYCLAPYSKWTLSSSITLQNSTKVWLILKLNEMVLHHPITDWSLNGNRQALSRDVGEHFCLQPPRDTAAWNRGWGMGGLMNKYGQEVCDNSCSEMLLSTSHITLFWLPFSEPDQEFVHFSWPHGCLSHYTEKMRRNRGQENLLKLAFRLSVSLIGVIVLHCKTH